MIERHSYHWIAQNCPICELPPDRYLGRRGGTAHRTGLGVECRIWRCVRCDLTFANPMPIPLSGLEQHYAVPPDEYFQHHAADDRTVYAALIMQRLTEMKTSKGRL